MNIAKKNVQQVSRCLQVCDGQDEDAEAAVHTMYDLFQQGESEAALLVDADNRFNSISRKSNASQHFYYVSYIISNCINLLHSSGDSFYLRKQGNQI